MAQRETPSVAVGAADRRHTGGRRAFAVIHRARGHFYGLNLGGLLKAVVECRLEKVWELPVDHRPRADLTRPCVSKIEVRDSLQPAAIGNHLTDVLGGAACSLTVTPFRQTLSCSCAALFSTVF